MVPNTKAARNSRNFHPLDSKPKSVLNTSAARNSRNFQPQSLRRKTNHPQTGRRMEKFDPFNFPEGRCRERGLGRLAHFDCESIYPNCALVNLYAKMGLHRYNLLEGTNLQLHSLKSFNMRANCGASIYYITLAACLPATGLLQIFQVEVNEECLGVLALRCPISRPQVTESSKEKELPFLRPHCEPVTISKARLPGWPSSEIAFTDTKRFYLVKESELQYNDWISLYVELAICTSHRYIKAGDLAKFDLEIVQVAIETLDVEPPRLDSKNCVVYIAYKDLAKARVGKPCHHKAIVRRLFNQGMLSLQGKCWREAKETLASKKKYAMLRRFGNWRLSNPRWHHAYKKAS